MIDIWGVIANSLWVLGLSVLLAALSWAHWVASTEKCLFRKVLKRPATQLALDLGLFLFCSGLAATARTWWERVLWGLLAIAWVVQAYLAGRGKADASKGNEAN